MKKIEDLTFDELVELASLKIHSALLEGGDKEMKQAVFTWMEKAVKWGGNELLK